jgi:hypothetical protein
MIKDNDTEDIEESRITTICVEKCNRQWKECRERYPEEYRECNSRLAYCVKECTEK